MKKFLSILSNDTSPSNSDKDAAASNPSTPSSLVGNIKNRLRVGRPAGPNPADPVPSFISNAAITLADSVQEIVSDTANLKGDSISGYQTLLDILDNQSSIQDPADVSRGRGEGCLNILLLYVEHPRFVELCNQANLVTVLFQALRLLRMMEIKQSKSADISASGRVGVTFNATANICRIMEKLCSQASTIEQVRQSLVKILTFPLGIFPARGIHLQTRSATIVFAICRTGLSSQQIWFLHDVQAMSHMIKQLGELVTIVPDARKDSGPDANDFLLRGLSAEKEGIWLTALRCIVEVVNTDNAASAILLRDFEVAGGAKVFQHVLSNASPPFFLQTLNTIMAMFTGPSKKADDMLAYTCVPNLISAFLLGVLNLPECIKLEATTDDLIESCHCIMESLDGHFPNDYIVQSMAYSLLTLYSNDPANCISLESRYCFLPMLIISIPCLSHTETITAVLTTANYICQCSDQFSESSLRALCAACSVSILRGLDTTAPKSQRQRSIAQADLLFASVEAIVRSSTTASETLLRSGFVKHIMSEPFEKLWSDIQGGAVVDSVTENSFRKIVDLVIAVNGKSNKASEDLRKSGVGLLLKRLVALPNVSTAFLSILVRLYEEFSRANKIQLQESLLSIIGLVCEMNGSWDKIVILFESLWRILIDNDSIPIIHIRDSGIGCAFRVLKSLKGAFSSTTADTHSMASVLVAVVRFLSLATFVVGGSLDTVFAGSVASYLVDTGIFESSLCDSAVSILFQYITIFSQEPNYIYGPALDVVAEIFALVSSNLVLVFLTYLVEFIKRNLTVNKQVLVDADAVYRLLRKMNPEILHSNSVVAEAFHELVSLLCQHSLTLESGNAVIRYLIRPGLQEKMAASLFDESDCSNNSSALSTSSNAIRTAFRLFSDEDFNQSLSPFGQCPHFALTVGDSLSAETSSSLAVFFNENAVPFLQAESTISLWMCIPEQPTDESLAIVPLFYFSCRANLDSLNIELNLRTSEVIIISSRNGTVQEEVAVFKPVLPLNPREWMHLAVTFQRKSRFNSRPQLVVAVFMNGVRWQPATSDCVTSECFTGNVGEVRIGYTASTSDNISARVRAIVLNVASFVVYDTILLPKQVAALHFQGPELHVVHPDFVEDDGDCFAQRALRIIGHESPAGIETYLEKVDLKGLELSLDPSFESTFTDSFSPSVVQLPSLPTPLVVITAQAAREDKISFSSAKMSSSGSKMTSTLVTHVNKIRHAIVNVAQYEDAVHMAVLSPSARICHCSSFGSFVSSLGGSDNLMPLIFSARDDLSLRASLRLLLLASRQNPANERQLQQQVNLNSLAFLLFQLPRNTVTHDTLTVVLSFVIDRFCDTSRNVSSSSESLLMLDTAMTLFVVFNDKVWNSFSSYRMLLTLLDALKAALKDERHEHLNSMRLAAMGTVRWLLILCLHLMERSQQSSGLSRKSSGDGWTYKPRADCEVADFRDDAEEFLDSVTTCILFMLKCHLRGRDIEVITSLIHYSFEFDTVLTTQAPSTPQRDMSEQDDRNDTQQASFPFCTFPDASSPSTRLSSLAYFRIFLMRLLFSIYEQCITDQKRVEPRRSSITSIKRDAALSSSSQSMQIFRQKCGPVWILSCLEQSADIATTTQALRLLGFFLKNDIEFAREFHDLHGYQILYHRLCSGGLPQEIPVVLPIAGMLFGIPMQMLLSPSQVKSVGQFSRSLDLDECSGPAPIDPEGTGIDTLSILNIFYECMVNAERNGAPRVVALLSGTLRHAFENSIAFRDIMQHKVAIEIHVCAMLSCTNAYAEFGSKILLDQEGDLTASIRDDYIRLSGGISSRNDVDAEIRDWVTKEVTERSCLEFTNDLGHKLLEDCGTIMLQALKPEQDAQMRMLYSFLVAFNPKQFSASHEHDFQLRIIGKFADVATSIIARNSDIKIFASIARNLSFAIPLSKAGFLFDVANLELLKLNLQIIRKLVELMSKHTFLMSTSSDGLRKVMEDFGGNARFLAIMCLHTGVIGCGNFPRGSTLDKLLVLSTITSNLDILFHPYLENSNDGFAVATARFLGKGSMDERSLQSSQVFGLTGLSSSNSTGGMSQRKSTAISSINQVRLDRNRLSVYFAIYMMNFGYVHSMDETLAIRTEAIGTIAFISARLKPLLEPVFGNPNSSKSKDSADAENDVFYNFYKKLVANDKGEFDLTLRGGSDLESDRFADFSFWISDNIPLCDRVFRGIEASLNSILPNMAVESDELVRTLGLLSSAQDLSTINHADALRFERDRKFACEKAAERVVRLLALWRNEGVRGLTVGALHWKQVWTKLQSSPTWGNDVVGGGGNQSSPWSLGTGQPVMWRVDACKGPERTRRKLLQDFSRYNPALYGDRSQASSAALKSPTKSSDQNIGKDENDIEKLLKEMNKKGILRRPTNADSDGDLEMSLDEISSLQLATDAAGNDIADNDILDTTNAAEEEAVFDMAESSSKRVRLESAELLEDDVISSEDKKSSRSLLLREIIKGIVSTHELKSCMYYNVERILGLESQKGVLFLSEHGIHIVYGIFAEDSQQKMSDVVFDWAPLNIRKEDTINSNGKAVVIDDLPDDEWLKIVWKDLLLSESAHHRFPVDEIYSFFKRRYQLKYSALEITDTRGLSVLFSCESVAKCDEILSTLLERDLPSSIFNKMVGLKNLQMLRGAANVYKKLMAFFLSSLTVVWQQGQITNFEYLMNLNSVAGRSILDLTQYPVFPWILCDYSSDDLDLDDETIYRDLSKPMGAMGSKRASQYMDRYQTMDEFCREGVEGSSPPFHYGTHYSCAGYVLHYLLRLQPYANMSIVLQGGAFDKPDRLFSSIESSWLSASQENLQDVRELIPEFYYLPEFLTNINGFNFGVTQKNEVVNNVSLPKWAGNDPKEFIRIHRAALESRHVSENLHSWIDLIFGFKQRGKASIDAMNVFIHITYEDEVDLDAIDDPILRTATLAQINNFGQTPSKIFHKPHPRKFLPEVVKKLSDNVLVEPVGLSWHGHLAPPLTVVGAQHVTLLNKMLFATAQYSNWTGKDAIPAVADLQVLSRDRLIASPEGSILVPPFFRKVIKFKSLLSGIVIQSNHAFAATRALVDNEKEITYHEHMHSRPITCAAMCKSGEILATGSEDMSVRVWKIVKTTTKNGRRVVEVATFSGHESAVRCLEVSSDFSVVVSGGMDRRVCIWDYRNVVMIRSLPLHSSAVLSVSVNALSGFIVTLTAEQLRVYHLNGELINECTFSEVRIAAGTTVLAPPCGEWQNAVVAVTGHDNGDLFLWKLEKELSTKKARVGGPRILTPVCQLDKVHRVGISVLRLCHAHGFPQHKMQGPIRKSYEEYRNMDLVVGDSEGKISRWSPARLDQLSQKDLMLLAT